MGNWVAKTKPVPLVVTRVYWILKSISKSPEVGIGFIFERTKGKVEVYYALRVKNPESSIAKPPLAWTSHLLVSMELSSNSSIK